MKEYKTLKEIVEQLEFCEYVTKDQLHKLEMNVAFIKLKEMAEAESVPAETFVMPKIAVKQFAEIKGENMLSDEITQFFLDKKPLENLGGEVASIKLTIGEQRWLVERIKEFESSRIEPLISAKQNILDDFEAKIDSAVDSCLESSSLTTKEKQKANIAITVPAVKKMRDCLGLEK